MRVHPPPDRREDPAGRRAEATDITLDGLDPSGRAPVLGTISWSIPRRGGVLLSADQFLATLEQFRERSTGPWDLLLASGRTLRDEPEVQEVLARTDGSPVLFEVADPGGTARWLLAHQGSLGQSNLLRSEQILFRSGDDEQTYQRLVSDVACGHGVIRLQDQGMTLVLFICGENNALRCDHRNLSVLYYPSPGLVEVLGARWIALNPAHSPYWPQSKMTGFAKVGRVGGVGQTMARTVARRGPYADGTRPPVAFLHGNNFYADEPRTRAYASVAFEPEGRMAPDRLEDGIIPVIGDGPSLDWIAALYRIPG